MRSTPCRSRSSSFEPRPRRTFATSGCRTSTWPPGRSPPSWRASTRRPPSPPTPSALGGDYARLRTDCRLVGRGATGNLLAVYFGEGDQTLDFRTFQDHRAPDTTSDLLFKGAVGGRSRSVYTGLIRVEKEARGTNAFQTNRNIKLSDDAWAESVPNLEIENNDVRCSHASTVGPGRRGAALLPGEPRRAAHRWPTGSSWPASSTRSCAGCPPPALAAAVRARISEKLDHAGHRRCLRSPSAASTS